MRFRLRPMLMTPPIRLHWPWPAAPRCLLMTALLAGPAFAQATRAAAPAAVVPARLDTAAILASARPAIDAANAAWLPGLRRRDADAIVAAYSDSGLFIAGDGTVTRGRTAVARMYAAGFPRLRPILAGAVVQDGMTVLGPSRIAEWGHAWVEFASEHDGESPRRRGGSYLTVWQREDDGRWRITRNLAF